MKIYVVENYHDNDSGIFTDLEVAKAHLRECGAECVQELELDGKAFRPTEVCVYSCRCPLTSCKKEWLSDELESVNGYCCAAHRDQHKREIEIYNAECQLGMHKDRFSTSSCGKPEFTITFGKA